MSRIRVDELHTEWIKDAQYRREYEALESEFSLAAAFIEARTWAGMTQEQVARLEGGRSKPSTRTLERFAAAAGHRLRIQFEEVGKKRRG